MHEMNRTQTHKWNKNSSTSQPLKPIIYYTHIFKAISKRVNFFKILFLPLAFCYLSHSVIHSSSDDTFIFPSFWLVILANEQMIVHVCISFRLPFLAHNHSIMWHLYTRKKPYARSLSVHLCLACICSRNRQFCCRTRKFIHLVIYIRSQQNTTVTCNWNIYAARTQTHTQHHSYTTRMMYF